MTALNKQAIFDKCERDGIDMVELKIKQGAYQAWKLPIIEHWLAQKRRLQSLGMADVTPAAPTALFETGDEADALSEDADREMIGGDADFIEDVGNK